MRTKKTGKTVKKTGNKKKRFEKKHILKKAKTLLNTKNSNEIYQKLLITSPDAVIITDLDGNILYASERAAHIYGAAGSQELIGRSSIIFMAPENREKFLLNMKRTLREGFLSGEEYTFLKSDGVRFIGVMNISVIRDAKQKAVAFLGSIRDVTKHRQMEGRLKKNEEEIKNSEEMYRSLIDASPEAILVAELDGRIIYASDKAVELNGAPRPDMFVGKNLFEFVTPEEKQRVLDVFNKVICDGVVHNFEAVLVRYNNEKIIGEANGTLIKKADGSPKAVMITIRDVTEKKKMETELKQSYTAVKKVMDGIITAMEKLVEKKDMYTVGHQHRTAQLARAIAAEMGLPPEQINCVYISALIHDIGKIFVSGSILNKIGSLTAEEYDIIKKHPEAGYDVLKSIDFPWPIADIILQHHERLDGSGYPYGLKEDKIYLESRIISVADVVEAITFARPYRPAFGIDVALEEVENNKGKLFDVEVVDICVSLVRKKGFKFESNS